MQQHKPYNTAAQTDVLSTWRRFGFVPPSEQQEYKDKWDYYKRLHLLEEETPCESH